jgi:hypothetical protein
MQSFAISGKASEVFRLIALKAKHEEALKARKKLEDLKRKQR